jgi:mannosyltransferase OCH1-like enzyme
MPKLYDSFMFSNEEDLLLLRIVEGLQYVEKFIIIESRETHSGYKKPLYSLSSPTNKAKQIFETYKDKIIHHIIDEFPKCVQDYPKDMVQSILDHRPETRDSEKLLLNWLREGYQRSVVSDYISLDKNNLTDIFIISDLDEIPDYKKITEKMLINDFNILYEKINYGIPTYMYNIHYILKDYLPYAAFTCPGILINQCNINNMRFHYNDNGNIVKRLNGYFYHLNRFLKPDELIKKEYYIAEGYHFESDHNVTSSCSAGNNDIVFDEKKLAMIRRNTLLRILSPDPATTEYISHPFPNHINLKNINILPKLYLLTREEASEYLGKINKVDMNNDNAVTEIEKICNELNSLDSIIPLCIYQTWHTTNLPPKMQQAVNTIKAHNPEFQHFLYDDNMCREFIKNNFPEDVLRAYDFLIPGAYKADLWRYCILYKKGGIYLDIRYVPFENFKFLNLTKKEHFVIDLETFEENPNFYRSESSGECRIYNALMVTLPGNQKLYKSLYQIVCNVKNRFYGKNSLEPTGPNLLKKYFTDYEKLNIELRHDFYLEKNDYISEHNNSEHNNSLVNKYENNFNQDNKIIKMNDNIILKSYEGYYNELKQYSNKLHYGELWEKKNIYKYL